MGKGNATLSMIAGAGVGAGLMYILDPDRGNRRRALVRDKGIRMVHEAQCGADKVARDLGNRAYGTVAETWHRVWPDRADDAVVVDRVRARLGRAVSHPGSIAVRTENGRVILSGPVLEHEVDHLIDEVSSVRGVRDIENRLEVHKEAGDVPGLQGGAGRRVGQSNLDVLQENWAPATRSLMGATGLALLLNGIARRGPFSTLLGLAGAGVLLRAWTNIESERVIGIGGGRRGIDLQKTINIHAPVEDVFKLWENPENFPKIMAHVNDVKRNADGTWRWTVRGPAGVSVSWDGELTQVVPNRLVAWRSLPGSLVRNAGTVHFDAMEDGGTRVHIQLSYNPPGGAIGHAIAALFGSDPRQLMHDEMVRMKSLFEHGKTRAHGHVVTREQVTA